MSNIHLNQDTASSKFTEFRKSCGGHSIDDTPAAPLLAKKSATSFPMIPICGFSRIFFYNETAHLGHMRIATKNSDIPDKIKLYISLNLLR